jgi:hypothetical protein
MTTLGIVLFFVGIVPFMVAYVKPIQNGKVFAACIGATALVSGAGLILIWP